MLLNPPLTQRPHASQYVDLAVHVERQSRADADVRSPLPHGTSDLDPYLNLLPICLRCGAECGPSHPGNGEEDNAHPHLSDSGSRLGPSSKRFERCVAVVPMTS
ncbi:hypothetical protein EGR_09738 [Echinococcus granulosus]|uniref:Uncharacterized protein n=1 Tax=Echinococcus granulosus TaxID=6210 RepID=W6UA92_ECHGR|nr:hypothetical protein EGR_09738 [Echinococcus granulosus]EUB55392.1 hypothetical protein EGR_09738 [Echinococcus granulosus]